MIECDKSDGTKCTVGTVILDPLAWMLCLPGFRNSAARFKPADEETEAKVAEELARRAPVVDETRRYLQAKINELAASGKHAIDAATGYFKRQSDGTFGNLKAVTAHILETAEGYGLKPVVPTDSPSAKTVTQPVTTPAAAAPAAAPVAAPVAAPAAAPAPVVAEVPAVVES